MMRKLLIAFALLLILAGGAAWWLLSSLDSIVKEGIEHYGSKALGVNVSVGGVEISTENGRGAIRNMVIGNPSGYAGAKAMEIAEASVSLDVKSLRSDLVVIREINIDGPHIEFELVSGKSNFEVIQDNIDRYLSDKGTAKTGTATQAQKERKYTIHAANIRKAQVHVRNPLLKEGGFDFTLPDLTLRRIGDDGQGVTGGEAARIVTHALLLRIAAKALTGGQLMERGVEGAIDMLKELFRSTK